MKCIYTKLFVVRVFTLQLHMILPIDWHTINGFHDTHEISGIKALVFRVFIYFYERNECPSFNVFFQKELSTNK
jgi:hypothetical protein